MIQRIQTAFLLATSTLLTIMFFHPFISISNIMLEINGEEHAGALTIQYMDYIAIAALLILSTTIGYISIFLYRKRLLQIRLCIFNCLILLGLQGVIAYYVFTIKESAVFSLTAAFPIIAAILTFIALRYIARDEAMVRTMERLRK